jgi:hypothetical protein
LEGDDGQLIDQRFLPRIVEGELRLNMIGRTPTEVVHKKPADGGISATLASGACYVSYKPDDAAVVDLVDRFVTYDLPHVMPALGLQHFPLVGSFSSLRCLLGAHAFSPRPFRLGLPLTHPSDGDTTLGDQQPHSTHPHLAEERPQLDGIAPLKLVNSSLCCPVSLHPV